ncbi:6-phosphogluconolactonase [Enterococcus hulanensis]|uniref:6-phosphogluconolactonase n=1 Tax=Enterococcus hulanensis TaxID=2559929 RepID=UPI002890F27B|nr:6-phosphogluconolactonase [Enterococcus hulanensis]MDT2661010.1 6-phosphogluconolactonase [Enterococcus hulanensis]
MRIIVENDYEALSQTVHRIILGQMYQDRRINMSLTGGETPTRTYELLTEIMSKHPKHFTNTHFYNFDEMASPDDSIHLTQDTLDRILYQPGNISKSNIHPLTAGNYLEIKKELFQNGGLDLMFIGLGSDNHFCANAPNYTNFKEEIYSVPVKTDPFLEEHFNQYLDEKDIPTEMVTMGAAMLMKTKTLLMAVTGKNKAKAVKQMLNMEISTSVPATVLTLHPNFILILDKDASSEISFQ